MPTIAFLCSSVLLWQVQQPGAFDKDLNADDAIKDDVAQLLVEHIPFPYGILCGAEEKRQLMYTSTRHGSRKRIAVAFETIIAYQLQTILRSYTLMPVNPLSKSSLATSADSR